VVHGSIGRARSCEPLLTARIVAARLGVCTAVVYRLREEGQLPGLRIGGALRFEAEAVRSYMIAAGRGNE
jgi:excisionase family DNA binding protein